MIWRERDHPRDYRGRFTSSSGGWVQETLIQFGMARSTGDRILDAVENGKVEYRERATGGNSAYTEFVIYEMDDGSRVHTVRKRAKISDQEMEVWASQIGQAIGAPVPVVVEDPDDDSIVHMEWIDAEPAAAGVDSEFEHEDAASLAENAAEMYPRDALMLGLLDLLIGNRDRHVGNWLIGNGGIYGIDHSGSWTDLQHQARSYTSVEEEDHGFPWHPVHNDFTQPYLDDNGNVGRLPSSYDFGLEPFIKAGHGLKRLVDSGVLPKQMSKRLWSRWMDISGGGL